MVSETEREVGAASITTPRVLAGVRSTMVCDTS